MIYFIATGAVGVLMTYYVLRKSKFKQNPIIIEMSDVAK
jgi:hypothetical protein